MDTETRKNPDARLWVYTDLPSSSVGDLVEGENLFLCLPAEGWVDVTDAAGWEVFRTNEGAVSYVVAPEDPEDEMHDVYSFKDGNLRVLMPGDLPFDFDEEDDEYIDDETVYDYDYEEDEE